MKKEIKLSGEERRMLMTSPKNLLLLLDEISNHKDFLQLENMYHDIVYLETTAFFVEDTVKIPDEELVKKHAYANGKVNAFRTMVRLMRGARSELDRRAKLVKEKNG
jgi:hypothetical protein